MRRFALLALLVVLAGCNGSGGGSGGGSGYTSPPHGAAPSDPAAPSSPPTSVPIAVDVPEPTMGQLCLAVLAGLSGAMVVSLLLRRRR